MDQGEASSVQFTYDYDALGRRVTKTTGAGQNAVTTKYYYLGWRCIQVRDGDDNILTEYIYGNNLDEILQMHRYLRGHASVTLDEENPVVITDNGANWGPNILAGAHLALTNGTNTYDCAITSNDAHSLTVAYDEALGDFVSGGADYTIRAAFTYATDAQGNVVAISDASGRVIETMKYDVYGRLTEVKEWNGSALAAINDANANGFIDASEYFGGSLTKNPYLFQGQRLDPETGLYYFKNRYYDPTHGRFISRDPEGMVDGPNLYAFVNNNPINFVDPLGLAFISYQQCQEMQSSVQQEIPSAYAGGAADSESMARVNEHFRSQSYPNPEMRGFDAHDLGCKVEFAAMTVEYLKRVTQDDWEPKCTSNSDTLFLFNGSSVSEGGNVNLAPLQSNSRAQVAAWAQWQSMHETMAQQVAESCPSGTKEIYAVAPQFKGNVPWDAVLDTPTPERFEQDFPTDLYTIYWRIVPHPIPVGDWEMVATHYNSDNTGWAIYRRKYTKIVLKRTITYTYMWEIPLPGATPDEDGTFPIPEYHDKTRYYHGELWGYTWRYWYHWSVGLTKPEPWDDPEMLSANPNLYSKK